MNERNTKILYIVIFMFICLQCYKEQQSISLSSQIDEYEQQVKTATEWNILTREADKSTKIKNEFPLWILIRREVIIEKHINSGGNSGKKMRKRKEILQVPRVS